MSFRILFADDSMTAQNMGKKILTDAGYDVVAVSNGAAAVKKIAEQKPDIIILDIYMPGYSGLEVCDKVRASVDTLKTPVLLTVGKMEPYKPEDANRVRADGVIIKPFEASDLLAVIKKLEERVVPKTIAMAQDTVLLERPPDFTEFEPPQEAEVHSSPSANTVQATVDVPDNMATTAAFSDMLTTEPAYSLDPLPVPKPGFAVEAEVAELVVESAPSPAPTVESAPARSEEHAIEKWPPAPSTFSPVPAEVSLETFESAKPATAKAEENGAGGWPSIASTTSAPASEPDVADTVEMEGFDIPEPLPAARRPETEFSVAPEEIQIEPEPEKTVTAASGEPSSHEATADLAEGHKFIDPGLAIDVVSFDSASVQHEAVGTSASASTVSEVPPVAEPARHISVQEESRHSDAPQQVTASEDDFEARVAAAMSIYDAPGEEKMEAEPSLAEPQPAASTVTESAPDVVDEVTPSFEYAPPLSTPHHVETDEAAVVVGQHFHESRGNQGPMLMATEATQVIPVYLESPAEPKQEEPAAAIPQAEPEIRKEPMLMTMEATQVIPVYIEPPVEPKQEKVAAAPQAPPAVPEEPAPSIEQSVETHVEAALPAVTAAVAAAAPANVGADTQMITAVVDRILERLKPQMIEEISRELKQKK